MVVADTDPDFDDDAASVTASSSGLWTASATALAREGVDVVRDGREEERLADAREEVASVAEGAVGAQPGDIADGDDVAVLVATAVQAFGGLDLLVTSAGGPPSGAFIETEFESERVDGPRCPGTLPDCVPRPGE